MVDFCLLFVFLFIFIMSIYSTNSVFLLFEIKKIEMGLEAGVEIIHLHP